MGKGMAGKRMLPLFCVLVFAANVHAQEAPVRQGPTTLSETYDSWTIQCANQAQGDQSVRDCRMSQELLQQESRQRVLLFAVSADGEAAKATLILPFGLLLSEGISIEVEEAEIARLAFRTCLPAGCIVELDITDDILGQFESAESAGVLMTANGGQPFRTDVSLKGFSAAYRRLLDLEAG